MMWQKGLPNPHTWSKTTTYSLTRHLVHIHVNPKVSYDSAKWPVTIATKHPLNAYQTSELKVAYIYTRPNKYVM